MFCIQSHFSFNNLFYYNTFCPRVLKDIVCVTTEAKFDIFFSCHLLFNINIAYGILFSDLQLGEAAPNEV